jgi:hypothetical protein
MKRPKGPELKTPSVKVPAIVEDVYWDLRERRLLPLVALLVVGIAAVPFLLGGSEEPPAGAGSAAAPGAMADEGATLTVVQAKPGLRDYRKRLSDRDSSDPFRQQYAAPTTDEAQLNPETSEEGGGSPETVPVETGPSGGGGSAELTFFAFAIKVSITKAGGKASVSAEAPAAASEAPAASATPVSDAAASARGTRKERTVRDRVLPHTPLPGKRAPVVTYMGPNDNATKALMLVSTKVESVFGDTRCVTNEDVCQLIEVEPGFPVTFVYGANEVRYTINVIKIFPVVTGHKKVRR